MAMVQDKKDLLVDPKVARVYESVVGESILGVSTVQ
jgi:hypothetical protein